MAPDRVKERCTPHALLRHATVHQAVIATNWKHIPLGLSYQLVVGFVDLDVTVRIYRRGPGRWSYRLFGHKGFTNPRSFMKAVRTVAAAREASIRLGNPF